MKKIFYERVGRRYVPVYEYDSDLLSGLPRGDHLISVYPGGSSTRCGIQANYAALIAAARVAEDTMCRALYEASEIRRNRDPDPLTPEQKAAWEHVIQVFGDGARQLNWPSAAEVARAGIAALQAEAEKYLDHPAARDAYEQYLATCKLVSQHG